jgi:hypothetical protein
LPAPLCDLPLRRAAYFAAPRNTPVLACRPDNRAAGYSWRKSMFTLETSTEVAVAPDQAFLWLSDLGNLPKWQTGVFRSEIITPPPMRVGTRFRETFRVRGLRMTAECEVTALTAPRTFGFTADGPQMAYRSEISFEPVRGGTKITGRSAARMRGLWRLLEPLVKAESRREGAAEFARLKAAMEADYAIGTAPSFDAGPTPTPA